MCFQSSSSAQAGRRTGRVVDKILQVVDVQLKVQQRVRPGHVELEGVGRAHAVALLLGAEVGLRHLVKHDLLVHAEVVLALLLRHLPAAGRKASCMPFHILSACSALG